MALTFSRSRWLAARIPNWRVAGIILSGHGWEGVSRVPPVQTEAVMTSRGIIVQASGREIRSRWLIFVINCRFYSSTAPCKFSTKLVQEKCCYFKIKYFHLIIKEKCFNLMKNKNIHTARKLKLRLFNRNT